jgi:hypothetical protein
MRDKWHPLFAIADAAGGEWPEPARAAAVELEERGEEQEPAHIVVLRQLVALVEDGLSPSSSATSWSVRALRM